MSAYDSNRAYRDGHTSGVTHRSEMFEIVAVSQNVLNIMLGVQELLGNDPRVQSLVEAQVDTSALSPHLARYILTCLPGISARQVLLESLSEYESHVSSKPVHTVTGNSFPDL